MSERKKSRVFGSGHVKMVGSKDVLARKVSKDSSEKGCGIVSSALWETCGVDNEGSAVISRMGKSVEFSICRELSGMVSEIKRLSDSEASRGWSGCSVAASLDKRELAENL